MKIRNGFVSNSSSSSFIVRGFEIDKDTFKSLKIRDDNGNSVRWNNFSEWLWDHDICYESEVDSFFVGELFSWDCGIRELDLNAFQDDAALEELYRKIPELRNRTPKVYCGTIAD